MSLFHSAKLHGRHNIKWIRAIIVSSLCSARWEILKASVPSSINASPLFFVQSPAQSGLVSLSLSSFILRKKGWSYEQIPFSWESYLEELYRSAERACSFTLCFPLILETSFLRTTIFHWQPTLSFSINTSIEIRACKRTLETCKHFSRHLIRNV